MLGPHSCPWEVGAPHFHSVAFTGQPPVMGVPWAEISQPMGPQILAHLWHLGYSPEDIIGNIFRVCKTFQMAEYLKLEFIKVGLEHSMDGWTYVCTHIPQTGTSTHTHKRLHTHHVSAPREGPKPLCAPLCLHLPRTESPDHICVEREFSIRSHGDPRAAVSGCSLASLWAVAAFPSVSPQPVPHPLPQHRGLPYAPMYFPFSKPVLRCGRQYWGPFDSLRPHPTAKWLCRWVSGCVGVETYSTHL